MMVFILQVLEIAVTPWVGVGEGGGQKNVARHQSNNFHKTNTKTKHFKKIEV